MPPVVRESTLKYYFWGEVTFSFSCCHDMVHAYGVVRYERDLGHYGSLPLGDQLFLAAALQLSSVVNLFCDKIILNSSSSIGKSMH